MTEYQVKASINEPDFKSYKTVVIYLHGHPGVGKLRLSKLTATAIMNGKQPYYKNDGKWWDLYQYEDCVVWDDFRGKSYMFSEMVKLMDMNPYKVECKGGTHKFNSKVLFITRFLFFSGAQCFI